MEGGGFRKISKDDSKFHYARRLPVRMRAATSTTWIFCDLYSVFVGTLRFGLEPGKSSRQLKQVVLSVRFELRLKTESSINLDLL
jgi:hypothetical protein